MSVALQNAIQGPGLAGRRAGGGQPRGRLLDTGPEESLEAMIELNVSLDFACCECGEAMGVTVRCTGKGLVGGSRGAARVNVPCPTCGEIIQVTFETCGLVRSVEPYFCQRAPAPSTN